MATFAIEGDGFVYDGQPLRIISGAMHYFRIVHEYWEDRLRKLRACGFNTVETYIAWNVHEPQEGRFRFDGMADVERFVRLAGELGLHVILRPSPYICAEWEFGGLPSWLLADPDMRLRCSQPSYLAKVKAYYDELLPRLKPLLCTSGGPVIALQIENEYGSYGNDKNYLKFLKTELEQAGMDVLLFTSDGSEDYMLQGGTLPGVLATLNFGSKPEQAFAKLREYRPDGPLVCMEYWNGWFDHWGDEHHVRGFEDVVDVLDRILAMGASVNFYMFHGGTNFGFYNGANHIEHYEPTVTSYDYNALLSESGDPTDKYWAIRKVIGRYAELPYDPPAPAAKRSYGAVAMTERVPLFEAMGDLGYALTSVVPQTMERLGQDYGFIWYETDISGPQTGCEIMLQEVRDRAIVYVDGVSQGVVERWGSDSVTADIPAGGAKLGILVENMGRINYGSKLSDPKGITEGVKAGAKLYNQFLYGWTIRCLPLDDLSGLRFAPLDKTATVVRAEEPAFYRGFFEVKEASDTFLKLDGWKKGVVFVNGFNLGRYWEKGPQKTLYVPGPLLRKGTNEIVVFELHGTDMQGSHIPAVTLQDVAELG